METVIDTSHAAVPDTSGSNTPPPVILIEHLKKTFGAQSVLNDVSLQLNTGENLVVLGRSGSGKSVLIRCIVRLLIPDSGTIRVFGQDLDTIDNRMLREIRAKIGFLFQSGALYDSMTVGENLEFPLRHNRKIIPAHEITQKAVEALEHVGLPDTFNKMPSELSGGMRKRISLARTIVVDPQIMLYDEPTTGLDPATAAEISTLINDVRTKYKTSSIIITHDIECARATADRVIMLHDGVIHQEGTVESFETSQDPVLSLFFGNSHGNP